MTGKEGNFVFFLEVGGKGGLNFWVPSVWQLQSLASAGLNMAIRCAERTGTCTMLWQHEFYMFGNSIKMNSVRVICSTHISMRGMEILHCSGSVLRLCEWTTVRHGVLCHWYCRGYRELYIRMILKRVPFMLQDEHITLFVALQRRKGTELSRSQRLNEVRFTCTLKKH